MSESDPTIRLIRDYLHKVANGLMPIGGIISLMQTGKLAADQVQLQKLDRSIEKLSHLLEEARLSLSDEAIQSTHSAADGKATFFEITYISRCAPELMVADRLDSALSDIARISLKNNKNKGVGGVLLCVNEFFIQRIEGPKPKICQLMANIAMDRRNTHISVISSGVLTKPYFNGWHGLGRFTIDEESDSYVLLKALKQASEDKLDSEHGLLLLNTLLSSLNCEEPE